MRATNAIDHNLNHSFVKFYDVFVANDLVEDYQGLLAYTKKVLEYNLFDAFDSCKLQKKYHFHICPNCSDVAKFGSEIMEKKEWSEWVPKL